MKTLFTFLFILILQSFLSQNLKPYKDTKNNKYGYKNENGKVVFEPKNDYAYSFNENRSEVKIDLKYGHINQKGKPIYRTYLYRNFFFSKCCCDFIYEQFNTPMYIDLDRKYTSKDGKESNTKSFSFYFNSGLYRSKKVEYSGETNSNTEV